LRLHPFSLAELGGGERTLADLLMLGGFPEPFLSSSERIARRWSRDYRTLLVQHEVATVGQIQDLVTVELLLGRLPDLVGSPLSVNALREDLGVAHKTLARWLDTLERLSALFRIPPFGHPKIRAVKKEQKHYHYDWTLVRDRGPRFECLVACHLQKWVDFTADTEGREVALRYFRDTEGREVDFVVTENKAPILAVECKSRETTPTRSVRYFRARFPECPIWQLAPESRDRVDASGVRVGPAAALLASLV
jgi:hypothetical protein